MADICGVVAEFNPFHSGHAALLGAARSAGASSVVCVMSGNFVQRGAPAITDKRVRVVAALQNGADLVIELPLSSAAATAQRFARGAVYLLASLGCVDRIAFGSECGDAQRLKTLAAAVQAPGVTAKMREILGDGVTFAKARELAVAECCGAELAGLLAHPNNTLGVEYLREMTRQRFSADVFTIPRIGAQHHENTAQNGFASASYIRNHIRDFAEVAANVPPSAAELYASAMVQGLFPADAQRLETAMLAHLRRLAPAELAQLPDLSEGLENRLYAAIRASVTLAELEAALKTKRYTLARVRRLILSAFLGITAKDGDMLPPYVRILGFNAKGREVLAAMKRTCRLPVSASLADLRAHGGACERAAYLEELATDLYSLALPRALPCGYEYTRSAVFFR